MNKAEADTMKQKVIDLYFNQHKSRPEIIAMKFCKDHFVYETISRAIESGYKEPAPAKPLKVSDEQVEQIIQLYNPPSYLNAIVIAKDLGIPYKTVTEVIRQNKARIK